MPFCDSVIALSQLSYGPTPCASAQSRDCSLSGQSRVSSSMGDEITANLERALFTDCRLEIRKTLSLRLPVSSA